MELRNSSSSWAGSRNRFALGGGGGSELVVDFSWIDLGFEATVDV
jgi:hypothetical protein